MGDVTEAAAAHRGDTRGHQHRSCRGSERRARSHDRHASGPGGQPGRAARTAGAAPDGVAPDGAAPDGTGMDGQGPDTVAVLLRRLRDAAAAHDGGLATTPGRSVPRQCAMPN